MSSIQERLQLKRVPLDTWNIREQLCLASAVVRSGDQNWMSVSRALKTVGEPNRPPDWYSQKSCAAQYGVLLEHVETPKRKKRCPESAGETPQESIVKRLTQERIVEIQKTVAEMNQQYDQLKNEITEVRNPSTSDDRLRDIWTGIEAAKRARDKETARRVAWLKDREERRARADRTWRPGPAPAQPTTPTSPAAPATPSSPLLTSLLKSSPVVTTPQHIPHPASVVDTLSPSVQAPTLSMLLEKSPQHDNKYAAIEHIKSQLVQIEQQLKASSAPSTPLGPAPALAPAPAQAPAPAPSVDIDDIEIKAEDVYVFRDVDIHIPQVGLNNKNRQVEKLPTKKEEEEIIVDNLNTVETVKEEQVTIEDVTQEENVDVEIEQPEPTPMEVDEPEPEPEVTTQPPAEVIKLAFPEVKFPTTEIKVIQPDDIKIKEEKEVEVSEESRNIEEEIVGHEEERATETVTEEIDKIPHPSTPLPEPKAPSPERPLPKDPETQTPIDPPAQQTEQHIDAQLEGDIEQQMEAIHATEVREVSGTEVSEVRDVEDPQDIPLPPGPEPVEEPPLPAEVPAKQPEVELELPEQKPEVEPETKVDVTTVDVKIEDDLKKDEDAEDSIPLKQMLLEECQRQEPRASGAGGGAGGGAGAGGEERGEDAHTETDDDTPMELSREEEKDGKKKRDYSRKKKPDSRTCSGSESAPESPAASDADRQHRLWKKSVMLVYSRLCAHKYASLFLRPITDEEAPGYSLVVKRPMDLTTIRKNIENGIIRTTGQFQHDVLLMLSNALLYNSSEHSVYTMAKEMHEEASSQLGMLLAAQAHAGLCAAPPSTRKHRHRT